ncbi:MAG TPA: hypothetical protein VM935_11755 [Chitinophagaceae bacterium]|nr:hypothetical protein [Chitinophagaceae bacterium]
MKPFIIAILLTTSFCAHAQTKSSKADIANMQKLTPARVEAYYKKLLQQNNQQIKSSGNQYNLKVNEILLPDFKLQPPTKDIKKLSLIPKQPPTLVQLADGLRQSKKQLESVTPKAVLEEVKKIEAVQTPAEQQGSSLAAFYADRPAQALLLSMNAALQNMSEATGLNNLAAIFNMVKLEQKAVPILMNLLANDPTNSTILNNLGQAYMGMGDLLIAEDFLKRCLAEDEMNPEANHSMGLLKFFKKEYDEGMKYFERELQTAYRKSTLALLKQQGKEINLYQLRNNTRNLPQRDYFEEINLSKFVLPDFPMKSSDSRKIQLRNEHFHQSLEEEMMFWDNANSEASHEKRDDPGHYRLGIYSDLVNVMLKDLHGLFPSRNLEVFDKPTLAHIKELELEYGKRMAAIQCPTIPPFSEFSVERAYTKKCCDLKEPVIDAYLKEYHSIIATRVSVVLPRWKHYLNGLISVASLAPNAGNRSLVYGKVADYLGFLMSVWNSVKFVEPPSECNTKITSEEAEALIKSSREMKWDCPEWLNIEIDLKAAKLKADCSKYAVEVGKGLQASYEKDFTTGKSTLSAGAGIKGSFWHLGKASAKQMAYISFDNNNEFADFGLKGQAGASLGLDNESLKVADIGKISSVIAGVEGSYTLGLNSGFTGTVKGKGILSEYIKLEMPK